MCDSLQSDCIAVYGFSLMSWHFSVHRDVDDIHDMMDDIQEQNEIAEEISGALSQPIGFAQEIDDVSLINKQMRQMMGFRTGWLGM